MSEHKDVLAFAGATAILVGDIWRDQYHSMVAEKDAEIDRLKEEINRLRQYEDAVTSATDGSLLVWNLMSTNHTVIKNDYWQSHLEEIDRLKAELEEMKIKKAAAELTELDVINVYAKARDIAEATLEQERKDWEIVVSNLTFQLAKARAENERLEDKLSDAYDDHCDSH